MKALQSSIMPICPLELKSSATATTWTTWRGYFWILNSNTYCLNWTNVDASAHEDRHLIRFWHGLSLKIKVLLHLQLQLQLKKNLDKNFPSTDQRLDHLAPTRICSIVKGKHMNLIFWGGSKSNSVFLCYWQWNTILGTYIYPTTRAQSYKQKNYPPASEASRGVYWNQAQKNFTHPYTEYPWVSVTL